jgi:hypothetical protein
MLGFRFANTQPTQYPFPYSNECPRREGAGLALWHFPSTASIAVVPTASVIEASVIPHLTTDFQEVALLSQLTFRVAEPRQMAAPLNSTVDHKGAFVSADPLQFSLRLIDQVQVVTHACCDLKETGSNSAPNGRPLWLMYE